MAKMWISQFDLDDEQMIDTYVNIEVNTSCDSGDDEIIKECNLWTMSLEPEIKDEPPIWFFKRMGDCLPSIHLSLDEAEKLGNDLIEYVKWAKSLNGKLLANSTKQEGE